MKFPTTRWTQIVSVAAEHDDPNASPKTLELAGQALEELCCLYWPPIYAYARAIGNSHEDAEDLTQSFFQYLLQKRAISRADRSATKFRTFLLTHFKYVVSNEWRARMAEKRGGKVQHVSFRMEDADGRFMALAAEGQDPTLVYDRAWTVQVVDAAHVLLQQEYSSRNSDVPFSELRGYLPGGGSFPKPSYEELATRYPAVSKDVLMTRVRRLRSRFPDMLRNVIAETVADRAQVEEELRYLTQVLTSH